jgi:hypothetical protein
MEFLAHLSDCHFLNKELLCCLILEDYTRFGILFRNVANVSA